MIICGYPSGKGAYPGRSPGQCFDMYFGSVKFFRHLILTVVFGWLGIATVLAVFFAVKCHMLSSEAKDSSADTMSVEEYVAQMEQAGISDEEIIGYINSKNAPVTSAEEIVPEIPSQTVMSEDVIEPPTEEPVVSAVSDELFPDMYSAKADKKAADSSTVFLTFEGDISENASDILIILKRQNVNGAFFISDISPDYKDTLISACDYGCTLGVFAGENKSYLSAEEYLSDFHDTYSMIANVSGTAPSIYRIPDTAEMSPQVRENIINELDRRGFTEIGYNADSGDASPSAGWQSIMDSSTKAVFLNQMADKASVLRFHSGNGFYTSVITAEDVIIELKADGFKFAAPDNTTETE